jgi:hypothetical protein
MQPLNTIAEIETNLQNFLNGKKFKLYGNILKVYKCEREDIYSVVIEDIEGNYFCNAYITTNTNEAITITFYTLWLGNVVKSIQPLHNLEFFI